MTPRLTVNELKTDKTLILILRLGTFLCFAGWTWGHLYWEGPYGILLWDESTYELAESFGVSWDSFVGTGADDGLIQKWIGRIGWLYLVCCILTLTVRERSWFQMAGLVGGSGLLTFLSYAKYVSSQRQLAMFIEHGGQMLMPVILVLAIACGVHHRATVITAVVAFIMTFAGHGSFALDFWPTPATFYAMTSVILGTEYEISKALIRVAGVLDFVVCIGLFIPILRRPCVLYAAVWGLLTAIARPAAGMSWDLYYWGADQFIHEAVLRAPHYLIPLYLFVLWRKPRPADTLTPLPHGTDATAATPVTTDTDKEIP